MSDNNVAYNSQNPNIQSCKIITSAGAEYDLKDMILEISYHEDIFSFSSTGYIMIQDGRGLIEIFQLKGIETLELRFDRMNDEKDNSPMQTFVIYAIEGRKPTGTYSSEIYKLCFCTKDFLLNSQYGIGKSYKGKKIHEMVDDILRNELGSAENAYLQKTTGYYDIIVPVMYKPFEAISWLSNIARPENSGLNGTTGADMFFFHNRYGYFFNSLNSLMSSDVYGEYSFQQNNLSSDVQDMQSRSQSVLNFEIVKSFNTLKDISSGAYANKIIAVNLLTGETETKVFDYSKYVSDLPPSNGIGVLPPIINARGQTPNEAYNTKSKVVVTNSGNKQHPNYKNSPQSVNQDLYMDVIAVRNAQVALMQRTVIKIVVPGDSHLTVGKTINFNYYSLSLKQGQDSRDLDEYYSGKYLITAVRHIIQAQGVFQTVLELSRDGPTKGYAPTNDTKGS